MSVFEHDAALTAIVQDIKQCGNGVADCIAPVQQVPSCTYKYTIFDNEAYYKIPQAKLAGCAYPNEIECLTFETKIRETNQYFLDKYVCERDLACWNASPCNTVQFDWLAKQAQNLMNKLMLSHEFDVVSKAFDETKYIPYDSTATLNNGMCIDWAVECPDDQPHDPQAKLLEKLMCLIEESAPRYNYMVIGRSVLNAFRRHPDFLGSGCVISNLTDTDSIAALLGLDGICVSDNYYDAAPLGAGRDLKRFVDTSILLFHRSPGATSPDCGEANFGWTAQWRQTFAGRIPCPKRGGTGGLYLRAGHDIDVHIENKLGFLIKNIESKAP